MRAEGFDHKGLFKYDVSVFWAFWDPPPPPVSKNQYFRNPPPPPPLLTSYLNKECNENHAIR